MASIIKKIESIVKFKKTWQFIDSVMLVSNCMRYHSCERIELFFGTHFEITDSIKSEMNRIANVYFVDFELFEKYFRKEELVWNEHFTIRKSSSSYFQLSATEYSCYGYSIFVYDQINTIVAMKGNNIIAFISDKSEFAIIELFRDLVAKDQENKGALFLHAAAVVKNDKAYIICGKGGAGKSTTLLEMIFKYNFKFLSGDKVVFKIIDGKVFVHGWPDYPNLGVGTLQKYETLKRIVPSCITDLKSKDKILIDFATFYSIKGLKPYKGFFSITCFLFPDINLTKNTTEIIKLPDITEVFYKNLEFREDYDYRKWQRIIEINYDRQESIVKISKCIENIIGYEIIGQLTMSEKGLFHEGFIEN